MKKKSIMREEKKLIRWTAGFTLVELIVVLVILSILSAVAVPALTGYIDNGKAKECKAKVEALAVEVASAKMASEINGEAEDEGSSTPTLDVQNYINTTAGENGKCPQGETYLYESNRIKCPIHDVSVEIPNSGKFTVAVAEPERESEIKVETPPTPESDQPESPEDDDSHTYTFTITPDSGTSMEDLKDMEAGASADLTVQVYEDGNPVSPDRVTVEWHFPGCVSGTGNGMSATVVAGQTSGSGSISCTITVTDEKDSTKKSVATGNSVDVSVKGQQSKPRLNNVPDNLKLDKGETNSDLGSASVSDYPGTVKFKYESSNSSGLEVDPSTGEVHALESGWYTVTVTATDESGNTIVDENGNPMSKSVSVLVPTLFIEVKIEPSPVILVEEESGSLTATAVVREQETWTERSDKTVTLNSWVSGDDRIAAVGGQGRSATVTGVKVGDTKVTVTAAADGVGSASASADIKVTKENTGLFIVDLPNPLCKEMPDVAGTVNHMEEFLNMWVAEDKKGGTWSGIGLDTENQTNIRFSHDHESDRAVFTYTLGNESASLAVRIVHPLENIQINNDREFYTNTRMLTGIVQQLNPYYTTDSIQEWNILEGAECIKILELTKDGTEAKVGRLKPGTVKLEFVAPRLRGSDIPKTDPKWEPLKYYTTITIKEAENRNHVEVDPAQLSLKVEDTATITAKATLEAEDGSAIDMSKVTYQFSGWAEDVVKVEPTPEGKALVKGLSAGNTTVEVDVFYDGLWMAYAECPVKVEAGPEPLPKNEVEIDGQRFKATSWEEFQTAVNDNLKYRNNEGWNENDPDKRDSPIYYDEVKDENDIIRRRYYVALGTGIDYEDGKNTTRRTNVHNSKSFEDFIIRNGSDGKKLFVEISEDAMKNVPSFSEEKARNDTTKYPLGTIVKIIRENGAEEYYIANGDSENKRELWDVFETKTESGWWRLDILP